MEDFENHHATHESDSGSGFSMIKNILSKLPMTKSLAVVFDFFESCGISMKQLQKMASGNASSDDLDKTITPIIYRTVPALQGALEYLEDQYADGEDGGAFLLVKKQKTKSGDIVPYVFICTMNEDNQVEPRDNFPYFKSASFILRAMDKNKLRSAEPEKALPAHQPEQE